MLEARLQAVTERLGGPAPQRRKTRRPLSPAPPRATRRGKSPAERDKFINQMVEGLAARLKENGKDLEGWMRLLRSYMVLGRRDEAVAALSSARGQFTGDEKSLAELNVLAESLGLGS